MNFFKIYIIIYFNKINAQKIRAYPFETTYVLCKWFEKIATTILEKMLIKKIN